jgi:hypothetical protein
MYRRKRHLYRIFVSREKALGRPRHRQEDNVIMVHEDVNFNQVAQ